MFYNHMFDSKYTYKTQFSCPTELLLTVKYEASISLPHVSFAWQASGCAVSW